MIFDNSCLERVKRSKHDDVQIGFHRHRTLIPAIHVTDFIAARAVGRNTGISKNCQYNVVRLFDFHFDEH